MKLFVALTLNAALLWWLLPWLRRQWQQAPRPLRYILFAALAIRLLVGGLNSAHMVLDPYVMSEYSYSLTKLFWVDPLSALHYLRIDTYHLDGFDVNYYGTENNFIITSNSIFVSKLLMWVNLASLSTGWLNGIYCSLFAFIGSWKLVCAVGKKLAPSAMIPAAISFFFWPSVIGFASGVRKETLILGSGAWLVAATIQMLPFKKPLLQHHEHAGRSKALQFAGVIALAILHIKFRYFFALPLIACLAGLAMVQVALELRVVRSKASQMVLIAVVLGLGIWVGPKLSHVFTLNKFTSQLTKIYTHQLATSKDLAHIEYPELRPTVESISKHAPLAIANTMVRPFLGESSKPTYIVAGLDNTLIMMLLVVALGAIIQGKPGRLPFAFVLALVVFCLIVAFLIGISTPNIGNLHRYRSGFIPYLVFLLLQNDYIARLLGRVGIRYAPAPEKEPAPGAVSLPN